jgi:hypothetical protein
MPDLHCGVSAEERVVQLEEVKRALIRELREARAEVERLTARVVELEARAALPKEGGDDA